MIRVLVVDDSAVMRAFLGRVIGAQPDIWSFATGEPDVVTLNDPAAPSANVT